MTSRSPVTPHDPGFAAAYGAAWSAPEPDELLAFFADGPAEPVYVEGGMSATYTGKAQIGRFVRFMQAFAPENHIEFGPVITDGSRFAAEWLWSGTATGPLRLGERLLPAAGARFSVPGVAVCDLDGDGRLTRHTDYYNVQALVDAIDSRHPTPGAPS